MCLQGRNQQLISFSISALSSKSDGAARSSRSFAEIRFAIPGLSQPKSHFSFFFASAFDASEFDVPGFDASDFDVPDFDVSDFEVPGFEASDFVSVLIFTILVFVSSMVFTLIIFMNSSFVGPSETRPLKMLKRRETLMPSGGIRARSSASVGGGSFPFGEVADAESEC